MKLYVFLICIICNLNLYAGIEIVKVEKSKVIVKGDNLQIESVIYFLDQDLTKKAEGKVQKITKNGTAVVKVTLGKVQKSYVAKVEKSPTHVKNKANASGDLSAEDRKILREGEISAGQHIGGSILAFYPGLGVGHAVQGRYSEIGWKFTVAEIGFVTLIISSLSSCTDGSLFTSESGCVDSGRFSLGLVGYAVAHIWEIVDAITGPIKHNDRYRSLTLNQAMRYQILPKINVAEQSAGLIFSYSF